MLIQMRIPKPIITIPAIVIVALAALGIAAKWHHVQSNNAYCSMNLRNYNTCIASCGIDLSCDEAWKDPEKTKELVWKLFQMRVPKCPSGGTYSLVYNRGYYRELPTLVCSMEQSHQHIDGSNAFHEQRIAERARMGSAIENVEAIATRIASRIERLKSQYPHLEHFSTAACLQKTPAQPGMEPGSPGNPELFSISYANGIIAKTPPPEPEQGMGRKRSAQENFDPTNGIRLYVHFFKGEARGADARYPEKIGTLSVHLYVTGSATEAIQKEIEKEIRRLQDDYRYDFPPIPQPDGKSDSH